MLLPAKDNSFYYGRALAAASGIRFAKIGTPYYGRLASSNMGAAIGKVMGASMCGAAVVNTHTHTSERVAVTASWQESLHRTGCIVH